MKSDACPHPGAGIFFSQHGGLIVDEKKMKNITDSENENNEVAEKSAERELRQQGPSHIWVGPTNMLWKMAMKLAGKVSSPMIAAC